MPTIRRLTALEILDSRGRPTIFATCTLDDGASASVSIPSGASTGRAEAHELRDGDSHRYGGLGCTKAIANIHGRISDEIIARDFSQDQLDDALIRLDDTIDKSNLGANAILASSLAFARACAVSQKILLYQHFANLIEDKPRQLPRLMVNLFSGGKHAGGQIPIQDVLLVPIAAKSIDESLATVYAVYRAALDLTRGKYQARALVADEGGLAPPFPDVDAMLADAV